ncbi:MAG TPA: hypothetical protein VK183_12000 [Flavobacterium sp.]|nr:hypothetical protein [Flavobacterium sp.]
MKCCLSFLLLSFYALSFAQSHVLVVYLNDAVSQQPVEGARVTLEGRGVKPLTAQYDPKQKAYFFFNKPANYTTVMVRHPHYNEKGFQQLQEFPKTLHFRLHTPYRVTSPDIGASYQEDRHRLAVIMGDTLYNAAASDPTSTTVERDFVTSYFGKRYPELEVVQVPGFANVFSLNAYVFYVTRKDRQPFARFNDTIIGKLQEDENILMLMGMALETTLKAADGTTKIFFSETGQPLFLPEHIRYHGDVTQPDSFPSDLHGRELYLSFAEKQRKGLIQEGVYTLKKSERDTLYARHQRRVAAGGLYEFYDQFDRSDTLHHNRGHYVFQTADYFPYTEAETDIERWPYLLISDAMALSYYVFEPQDNALHITLDYGYSPQLNSRYNMTAENYYRSKTDLLKRIVRKNATVYRLHLQASPFGIQDMLEYYNEQANMKLVQNIQSLRRI